MGNQKTRPQIEHFLLSLLGLTTVCAVLGAVRIVETGSLRYLFLLWNLFLAWLPLLLAWLLVAYASTRWQKILTLALWLLFLPNSFYIITDFIHLKSTAAIPILFDVVLLMAHSLAGLILGFTSILLIRQRFFRRLTQWQSLLLVEGVLLVSSFAIYLGRYLRWNTWDVLVNPFGLLVDVSDRFLNLSEHPLTLMTTVVFFLLLSSLYLVLDSGVRLARSIK